MDASLRSARGGDEARASTRRTRLLELSIAAVDGVSSSWVPGLMSPEEHSADFQVALPYRGILVWHVGPTAVVGDANQVLFVRGGESYRLSHPRASGYSELVITPEVSVLAEVAHGNGSRLSSHPLFMRRRCRAAPRLQSLRARLLHSALGSAERDRLASEELVLAILRSAFEGGAANGRLTSAGTERLIRRTKEFLEAELENPVRLADAARAVGASPAYLTDVFRRVEGTSLHQYLIQLRLAHALVELPHADDLTALALEIGFSSHSHFSAAFRRSFGCTPSEFRRANRRVPPPSPRRRLQEACALGG